MKKVVIMGLIMLLAVPLLFAIPTKFIDVFVFESQYCGGCSSMNEFLQELSMEYPAMVIHRYEISDEENKRIYDLFKEVYDLDFKGYSTPMVFIGKDHFGGYGPTSRQLIRKKIEVCSEGGCNIALCEHRDCIVVYDHTETPEVSGRTFLLPFLVIAGAISALTPLNSSVLSRVKGKGVPFFGAYMLTSFIFCMALSTVVFLANAMMPLELPLAVVAVAMGILSLAAGLVNRLPVPSKILTALDDLTGEGDGVSLFFAGVGGCLASLAFSLGIYLLAVFNILSLDSVQRIVYLVAFNGMAGITLIILYWVGSDRRSVYYGLAGIGSIALGVVFWLLLSA
jgi:thiol-disulfide isomerase/thioredoxin